MSRRSTRRDVLSALATAPLALACDSGSTRIVEERAAAREAVKSLGRLIVAEAKREGAGATVQRLFPSRELRHLDPFVLLDDFSVSPPAGFPMHPHRGFEAFTYMVDGAFHHRDNLGNDSVIRSGGTQRFTSGSGARHSEMPASAAANRGLQLWVNLPRKLKRMDPSYAGTPGDDIPVRDENGARVRAIVGEASPVKLQTDVLYQDVLLEAGGKLQRRLERGFNSLLYVMKGTVKVHGEVLRQGTALLPTVDRLSVVAQSAARVVLLSGEPHRQPIIQRGPFVD